MVTLRADAEVSLVRSQADRRRVQQDGTMFDAVQKERLLQRLEESRACSPSAVYLVLTASLTRAMLLRPDTGQYLIAGTGDMTDVG